MMPNNDGKCVGGRIGQDKVEERESNPFRRPRMMESLRRRTCNV